ncbi:esterase YqiA [Shewanella sp. C32]|uniref:Esterase YqiA n=1 Tax=Shewanella electrica TaxID=515560 RepID=A0ABT2FMN2_9GAMM|nr:YqiA/YcfP family alpha/beta fold hydrolase [Shewanella electrica]MCH1926046.1 esterase YqiA [Shewanella electrica]MCS4557585.1 esterase YqiA [Shewanella electrica]
MLLYIHGFNSSSLSDKAQQTKAYFAEHHADERLEIPQLPSTPQDAVALLTQRVTAAVAAGEPLRFIGSSLGGYFASYLAEQYGGKAVLINPAVKPYELFKDYLGEQINPYTGEHYQIVAEHQQQLLRFDTPIIFNPDRFFVLLQSGDEVLDYQQAMHKYHCCRMLVEAGGNHSFDGFEHQLADVCRFLGLS